MNTKSMRKLLSTSREEQQRESKLSGAMRREESKRFGEYSIGLGEEVRGEYGNEYAEAADLSELQDEAESTRKLRALGWPLKSAREQARAMREAALLAERGALRLLFVQDSCIWNADVLFGDCIRPSEEKRLWKQVEETGVFGIVAQVREDSGEWTEASAVWGFFGEQDGTLFGNAYVADALGEAVDKCAEQYAEQVRDFWNWSEER
jgi:hypothetical protein